MKQKRNKQHGAARAAKATHSPSPKVHPKASSGNLEATPPKPIWTPSATAASESTLRHLVYAAAPQFAEDSSGGGGSGGGDDDEATVDAISGIDESAYCLNTVISVTASISGTLSGNVTWVGDATFSNIQGATATAKLDKAGSLQMISAFIGDQKPVYSGSFVVTDRECDLPNSVDLDVPKPTPNTTYDRFARGSTTVKSKLQVTIEAYCDCETNKWRPRITVAKQELTLEHVLPDYDFDKEIEAAQCPRLRTIEDDLVKHLSDYGAADRTVADQIIKHEDIHVQQFPDQLAPFYSAVKNSIDALELNLADYPTAKQAKDAFEAMAEYKAALKKYQDDIRDQLGGSNSEKHDPAQPFIDVNKAVLQPLLDRVRAEKKKKNCN